jgi:flagellar motor switch protein FliN/FliY
MSDILSQDEIDRLLNATPEEDSGGDAGGALSESHLGPLAKIVNEVFTSANSTISTLIARDATVDAPTSSLGDAKSFDTTPSVVITAPFRSGYEGALEFIFEEKTAAILADLILGGEGEGKTALEEGDDDAVKEVSEQILGNAAPAITGAVSTEVGFGPASVAQCAQGELATNLGDGQLCIFQGQLKVEGVIDSPFRVVIKGDAAVAIADAIAPPAPPPPPPEEEAIVASSVGAPPSAMDAQIAAPASISAGEMRNIDLILDIEVEVMVRLGNALMPLREIQKLRPGSIVDLDRDTDSLVELVVNERTIAKGELVVVSSDHFALRVTEIVNTSERIRSLGG